MFEIFIAVPFRLLGGSKRTGAALFQEFIDTFLEIFGGPEMENLLRTGKRREQLQNIRGSREADIGGELAQARFEDLAQLVLMAGEALGQIVGNVERDVGHPKIIVTVWGYRLVLPIGGVKGKVLAARLAGLKRVVLPRQSEGRDLPEEVRREMEFIFADGVSDVLTAVLPGLEVLVPAKGRKPFA